jgi:hypothetical protein
MVTNVSGNQPGNAPEDHGSRLLNNSQILATVSYCGRLPSSRSKKQFRLTPLWIVL